jgi:hypothetical protein
MTDTEWLQRRARVEPDLELDGSLKPAELAAALRTLRFKDDEQLRYIGLDRDVAAYLLGRLREGHR